MKKVIFISALAIAAAVSCTKSDIVDTKFNEAISFETYLGRDAQTKATVATVAPKFGIYGYYTGTKRYVSTADATDANPASVANLWANALVENGTAKPTKYWTNDSDFYSFLAYAPYSEEENSNVTAPASATGNPVVTFTVPKELNLQSDFIYSNKNYDKTRKDVVEEGDNKGTILMQFQHALSRITVRASETHKDYTYTITGLELAGAFVKKQNFDLKDGDWSGDPIEMAAGTDKYTFNIPTGGVPVPNDTEGVAATTPVDCVTYNGGTQYLMVIPTTVENATLAVTYYTTYGGTIDSAPITKTVNVSQAFDKGKAYALNLVFGPNPADEIKFSVDVLGWDTPEIVVKPNPENPEQGA